MAKRKQISLSLSFSLIEPMTTAADWCRRSIFVDESIDDVYFVFEPIHEVLRSHFGVV